MTVPSQVKIVEVGPRDGLQNEATPIPTDIKVEFINQLSDAGYKSIEVTSFVSPKWIPQLADHAEVFSQIKKNPQVSYPVLVPNLQGFEEAQQLGVKEIAVFTTASEAFSKKNTNCTVQESLQRISEITAAAKKHEIKIRGYISCVLGCPYEGEMSAEKVAVLAGKLLKMGCYEISLGDTIGVGTPLAAKKLLTSVAKQVPIKQLAVHFHDTYGMALANIYAALEFGVGVIDSSVGGLGGCPYAKGAKGNVATETVLYMLNGMHIETGIDLEKVKAASQYIRKFLKLESS